MCVCVCVCVCAVTDASGVSDTLAPTFSFTILPAASIFT